MKPQRESQTTSRVLMVEPRQFGFNEQAAETNVFMHARSGLSQDQIRAAAMREFNGLKTALETAGVEVMSFGPHPMEHAPDSVFPNNWFSTHETRRLVLYPMAVPNRRQERRSDILSALEAKFGSIEITDLSALEGDGVFLEGTGSLILDRVHRIAYVGESSRASREGLEHFCGKFAFRAIHFKMQDSSGAEIYHTNVMMSVGEKLAVVCLEAIDESNRNEVKAALEATGHEILSIAASQLRDFCGNVLQLRSRDGIPLWVMSERAKSGFTSEQLSRLEATGKIVSAPLPVIEEIGGGSARCMIAELFL